MFPFQNLLPIGFFEKLEARTGPSVVMLIIVEVPAR